MARNFQQRDPQETEVPCLVKAFALEFLIGWITFRLHGINMAPSCGQKQLTQSFKNPFALATGEDFNKVFFKHVFKTGHAPKLPPPISLQPSFCINLFDR